MVKVSLACGYCNATSQISSYMHTRKEWRNKARIIALSEPSGASRSRMMLTGPRHLRYPQGSLGWSKKQRGMK